MTPPPPEEFLFTFVVVLATEFPLFLHHERVHIHLAPGHFLKDACTQAQPRAPLPPSLPSAGQSATRSLALIPGKITGTRTANSPNTSPHAHELAPRALSTKRGKRVTGRVLKLQTFRVSSCLSPDVKKSPPIIKSLSRRARANLSVKVRARARLLTFKRTSFILSCFRFSSSRDILTSSGSHRGRLTNSFCGSCRRSRARSEPEGGASL